MSAASPTRGSAHQRCRRDGSNSPGGKVWSLVSVTLAISVNGLTVRAAFIAGLAIAALLLTGWRKPARAEPRSPRGPSRRDTDGFVVDHVDAPLYHRPGVVRRLIAAGASGGLGVLMGMLAAIVIAFGVAFAVIWLTNLLQQ